MRNAVMGVCLAAAATVALGAQDKMMPSAKMDHEMAWKTYSGCVERSSDGAFTLAHAMEVKPAHGKDANMKMKDHQAMAKDGMAGESMKDEPMKAEPMNGESLALIAGRVDLAKHVGRKVSVSGTAKADAMPGPAAFSVTSVKGLAGSCS